MSSIMGTAKYGVFAVLFAVVGFLAGNQWHKLTTRSVLASDDNVVAVVDNTPITVEDFMAAYEYRGGKNVSQFDSQALIDELILTRALVSEAKKQGIVDDFETQHSIDNLIVGKLKQQTLEPRLKAIRIDATAINQHYLTHQQDFIVPERRRFAIIMQNKGDDIQSSDKNQYANAVYNTLANGLDDSGTLHFGKLAISQSDHQASRYRGGDIGWFNKDQKTRYPEPLMTAGFNLENSGDLSAPIWSQDRLYIVRLMDAEPARIKTLDEVEAQIKHELMLNANRSVQQEFNDEALASSQISVFADRLPKQR